MSKLKQQKLYYDNDLMSLCVAYLNKKKKEPTLWDLFWTMHKVSIKLEMINRKGEKIVFKDFSSVIDENWLNGLGDTRG